MIDSASILHDLDLLDDWLAGKGYGEEAGLVLRAMTLINAQAREIEKLRAKLMAATGELCDRAAAAALKETGDE